MSWRDWQTWKYARIHPNLKRITVSCNIRSYAYTAHLDRKTGKIMAITAGCRKWRTFKKAFKHYDSGRFSKAERVAFFHVGGTVYSGANHGHRYVTSLERCESRAVLKNLQRKCDAFKEKVR